MFALLLQPPDIGSNELFERALLFGIRGKALQPCSLQLGARPLTRYAVASKNGRLLVGCVGQLGV